MLLVDVGSKAGTKLNGKSLSVGMPYSISSKDKIVLGLSTRTYVVTLEYEQV